MYRDLLANSSLLVLPLAALVLFLCVFAGVVVRTLATKRELVDEAAALPLSEDKPSRDRSEQS
jgi:hypothetical protein